MGFVGRKPTNAPLTSDDIPNGIIGAADLATGLAKLTWDTSVKTSGFTASANTGYFCNTTSATFTVTLPSTPTAGDTIQLVDYAGTFGTNNITLGANGNKIEGGTTNKKLTTNREAVTLTYVDSTQGWVASSGTNYGSQSIDPLTYSVDFLVVAGGAGGGEARGGGGGAGGYRSSNSTYGNSGGGASAESSLTFTGGTVYTITVGAGGAGGTSSRGTNGSNSSISGTGITTITSTGGGGGAGNTDTTGNAGGSGGGANDNNVNNYGAGTANQGFRGGASSGGFSGGGGGAIEIGGTDGTREGGDGVASTITGSSVTRAGGGGGGASSGGTSAGGTGGGGTGTGAATGAGGAGTANTGGGGGGSGDSNSGYGGGAGGSGVVILRMPTSAYSGTTTGSPTVSTSGSDTILVYNASGSYTA